MRTRQMQLNDRWLLSQSVPLLIGLQTSAVDYTACVHLIRYDSWHNCPLNGTARGDRTHNPLVKSQMLYH